MDAASCGLGRGRCVFFSGATILLLRVLQPELATKGNAHPEIKVKAGQLIGRIGAQTLDFAVWNLEKPLKVFANPESYSVGDPWKIYTDNPYDYVSPDVKKVMLDKNPRTVEPIQGKINYATADGKQWDNSSLVKGLKVSPLGVVKGTILLQLIESGKLKVETFVNKKASQVTGFTSGAKIYVR